MHVIEKETGHFLFPDWSELNSSVLVTMFWKHNNSLEKVYKTVGIRGHH